MEQAVLVRLECGSEFRESASESVRDVLQAARCVIRSETERPDDEHGMLESGPVLVWLATTASGVTATVLGAMIYDALRSTRRDKGTDDEDRSELRVTRRSIEILDTSSGARITLSEETTELRGGR